MAPRPRAVFRPGHAQRFRDAAWSSSWTQPGARWFSTALRGRRMAERAWRLCCVTRREIFTVRRNGVAAADASVPSGAVLSLNLTGLGMKLCCTLLPVASTAEILVTAGSPGTLAATYTAPPATEACPVASGTAPDAE